MSILMMMILVLGVSAGHVLASDAPAVDTGDIQQKLKQIIQTQADIQKTLEEMKAELQIIKVRASQKG